MFNKKANQSDLPEKTATTTPTSAPTNATQKMAAKPAPSSPFPLSREASSLSTSSTGSRLHVGKDIHLKGEITACDRLIVEGKVEASMNSSEIEISETGIFIGEVNIDRADISGKFDGTLTAHKRLIIRKTGSVNGDIRYGEIEIEPGGIISGNFRQNDQPVKESDPTLSKSAESSDTTKTTPPVH
jgi:cytoskeletal protein CcmA (bactofilin family)